MEAALEFEPRRAPDRAETLTAYWVCMTASSAIRGPEDLDGFPAAMKRQLAWEIDPESVDLISNGLFRPLAAIQITGRGSPLPDLVEAFGQPSLKRDHLFDGVAVTSVWFSPAALMRGRNPVGGNPDRDRAATLLTRARHRAAALASGLVVVVRPRWQTVREAPLSPEAVTRMREMGFLSIDRRP